MVSICAIAIVGAILSMLLSEKQKVYSTIIGMVVSCIIFYFVVEKILDFFDIISLIEEKARVSSLYVDILLKMVGITLACEVTADLCSQADSAINGKQIRMFGKFCVLSIGYPIILELIELIDELLG